MASTGASASTPKGDQLLARAKAFEAKGGAGNLDKALELAAEALKTDPDDVEYALVEARIRAYAAQEHTRNANSLIEQKKLNEALVEYERASAIDPAPSAARTAARKLREMISTNPAASAGELPLNAHQRSTREAERKFSSIKPEPRLEVQLSKPLPQFKVNQLPSSEVFSALGRQTNVRVLFDPEYEDQSLGKNQLLDFHGLTLEEAFDYVALISKSFWKALSADTILVANEDPAKRGVFNDQIAKVLYITNAPTPDEVARIGETVRTVTDMKKLLVHPDQNALVLRGDSHRVALAEKLVGDLDKPKAEIIIDVLVLSVSKDWVRDIGMVFGITPATMNVGFQPQPALKGPSSPSGFVPLNALRHLSAGDFGITLPGAALSALLSNQATKILDKAQLRTVEGQKSSLRIGQKVPYATGSFTPGGASSASPLVNTQFSFFDVGLNLDVTAKVHESDEVSLHIESDHSSVSDYQNVGGLLQPVVTQRKRVADVRAKEGEVNFWDIVTQHESNRSVSGVPGLMNLPYIGKFFTANHREEKETLLLHLLVPHVVRSTDIRDVNIAGVVSGNDQVVKLSYAPPQEGAGAAQRSAPSTEVLELTQTMAAPAGAAHDVPVGFKPANAEPEVGQKFQVEITSGEVKDLTFASMILEWDAAKISLSEVKPGALMTRDKVQPDLKTDLQPGKARIDITRQTGTSGSGALLTLTFLPKGPGAGSVKFTALELKNAKGEDVPAAVTKHLEVSAK